MTTLPTLSHRRRRTLAVRSLGSAIVGVLATVLVVPAANAAVPEPPVGSAVISVKVGGDRLADGTVEGLAGVTLALHAAGTASSAGTPAFVQGSVGSRYDATWPWTTCVSDADGDCTFIVPINGGPISATGVPEDTRFWVVQESSPAGWYANPAMRVGGFGPTPEFVADYRFRTDTQLRAGVTYRSDIALMPPVAPAGWSDAAEPDRGFMRNRLDNNSEGGQGANVSRTTGAWSQSRTNPGFPESCAMSVGVVTDTSGSLGSAGMASVKSAMDTFIDAFRGTPTQVSIFSFSAASPGDGASNHPELLPVTTSAQADVVKSQYANWLAGGGTNWSAGLSAAANSGNDFDLVVMLTDGNPTIHGAGLGSSAYNSLQDVDSGIFSANQLKAAGTRVVAIGAGPALTPASALNLRAVSGVAEESDFFRLGNFAEAAATMAALAKENCQGSIQVQKMIVPTGGDIADAQPASAGWQFDALALASGLVVAAPTSTSTTADGNGTVDFGLSFDDAISSGLVQITETQQPGYELVQVGTMNGVCMNSETGEPVAVTNAGTPSNPGFSVVGRADEQVACTIYNTLIPVPDITVVKKINGDDANSAPGVPVEPGSNLSITFDVTNSGNVPLHDVTLTDDVIPTGAVVAPKTPESWDGSLAPGQTVQFTATIAAPATGGTLHRDVATATGDAPDGTTVRDDDPAHATTTGAPPMEPTPTPTESGSGSPDDLATTGVDLGRSGLIALVALAVGAALCLAVARRARR